MNKNEIQVFANKEFGEIRTVKIDGQTWLVLKDVCNALGIKKHRDTASRLDEDERGSVRVDTLGGRQTVTVISESGLYAVILRSDKPNARAFRKWVTSEVLPTIRKHGGYITDELLAQIADKDEEIKGFVRALAKERRERKNDNKRFDEMCVTLKEGFDELKEDCDTLEDCIRAIAPKAEYCDIILQCQNAIPVSVIAKDYGMTAAKFNKLLHSVGIQYKIGGTWLLYQKYSGCGFTETNTYLSDKKATVHTRWTQSGRRLIYDVLGEHGVSPECERGGSGLC